MKTITGFTDKLYWRETGQWHCFKRERLELIFTSLCGRRQLSKIGYGQQCLRPEPALRCAKCDVAEIIRRGKEESMPANARGIKE